MPEITEPSFWTLYAVPWAIKALWALVIFYVGRMAAKWVAEFLANRMRKHNLAEMLIGLAKNTAYIASMVFVVLAALAQLGVDTTSALAVFGAAGLAVGLAVKDSLSNFASGVLIAFFQPFRLGHYVEAAGTAGTVVEVGMFNTTLRTPDNKQVIVPNSLVYNDTIVNYSAEDTRRVDMVFGIGYGDDIGKARSILESILAADDRVLKEPATTIAVDELGESSVNFVVRPWVNAADYWGVRFETIEKVKLAFDESGISIPFPQQDVHMHQVETKAA